MTAEETASGDRRALAQLTSGRVIGWPLILSSFVIFLVDGFPFLGGAELDGSSFSRAGIVVRAVVLSQIPIALFLSLARFTWLKLGVSRRHPSVTILTFFIAAVIGDAVFQGSIAASSDGRYVAASLLENVLYMTAALSILGVIIVDLNEHRSRIRALAESRRQLEAAHATAAQTEQTERTAVEGAVAKAMSVALSGLEGDDAVAAADALRSVNRRVIRPLSHDLATKSSDFVAPGEVALPTPPWSAVLRSVLGTPLIAPRAMATLLVVFSFRRTIDNEPMNRPAAEGDSIGITFDLVPFVEAVSVLLVLFFATLLVARFVDRILTERLVHLTPWRRAWFNTLGILVVSVATLVSLVLAYQLPWFPEPPTFTWWTPLLTFVPLMLMALVLGLLRSLRRRRDETIARLTKATDELLWAVASINERLWHRRRALAHDVHGPIQSRLNAAAFELENTASLPSNHARRREALSNARRLVREASTVLDTWDSATVDVDAALRNIVDLWRGACSVRVHLDDISRSSVSGHPATATALVAVVEEACSNAASHGRATEVAVDVTHSDQRTIRVSVLDNGRAPASTSIPGLGSRLFNDVSVRWELTSSERGNTLELDLPVVPPVVQATLDRIATRKSDDSSNG